ncbi:MAG: hypothetical protein ACPGN3_00090 [Opitutales bacterium]
MKISSYTYNYTDYLDDAIAGVYPRKRNREKAQERNYRNTHPKKSPYRKHNKKHQNHDDHETFWQNA